MTTLSKIGNVMVDLEDPCAVAAALRKVELSIISGGGVVAVKISEHNEVRWSPVNINLLRDTIASYEKKCEVKTHGEATNITTRRAKRMRFV